MAVCLRQRSQRANAEVELGDAALERWRASAEQGRANIVYE